MLLKLFQAKQNAKINQISQDISIALTNKNNQQKTKQSIAKKTYIHIFNSAKIALSKKFKLNILNNLYFFKKLYLFAIDKIYLIKK